MLSLFMCKKNEPVEIKHVFGTPTLPMAVIFWLFLRTELWQLCIPDAGNRYLYTCSM